MVDVADTAIMSFGPATAAVLEARAPAPTGSAAPHVW